ncbi:MAG: lytic murein transglycosylase [Gammaproteobacteria bacterium]|nr:lytic murein transglycosylase [Gammaproteobacteria bacterium]
MDFDGDGIRDIWTSPVDAIGSVANDFARHGWRQGEPVLRRVTAATDAPLGDLTGRGLRPELEVGDLRAAGIRGLEGLDDEADATLWRLEGPSGQELVVGLHNFYVITRYNHSHLYALAVHDLADAIAAAREGSGEVDVGD